MEVEESIDQPQDTESLPDHNSEPAVEETFVIQVMDVDCDNMIEFCEIGCQTVCFQETQTEDLPLEPLETIEIHAMA